MMPKRSSKQYWKIYFYHTRRGRRPVKVFFDSLTPHERADVNKHLRLLREFGVGLGMPHPKEVAKPIWELRPEGFRVLYFLDSRQFFILLHGFYKKEDRIPQRHIDTAMRRMQDYEERLDAGTL